MNRNCPDCNHTISYWEVFKYQFSLKGIKCKNCNTRLFFDYGVLGKSILFFSIILFLYLSNEIRWGMIILFVFVNPLVEMKFAELKETKDEIIYKENEKVESEMIGIHMILSIRRIILYTFIFLFPALIFALMFLTIKLNISDNLFKSIFISLVHYVFFLIIQSLFIILLKPKFVYKIINTFNTYNGYFVAWLSLSFLSLMMFDFIVLEIIEPYVKVFFLITILLAGTAGFYQYKSNKKGSIIKINLTKHLICFSIIILIITMSYQYFFDKSSTNLRYEKLSQKEIWNHVFTGSSGIINESIDFVQVNYEESKVIVNNVGHSVSILDCAITDDTISCERNNEVLEINVVAERSYSISIFKDNFIKF